jgi:predicted phage terminase large subunit-like protein
VSKVSKEAIEAVEQEEQDLELLEELEELLEEEAYYRSEEFLHDFFLNSWPHIEGAPLADNWHIEAMCEHLQALYNLEIKKLLIQVPPRSSKSMTVGVMFPAWCWLKNPTLKFLSVSYGADLAQRDTRKSRRLILTDWYQRQWGDRFKFSEDSNRKDRYDNDKSGFRIATSVGGLATGEGADILICDDLLKADDAHSKAKREAANRYFTQTLSSRYADLNTFRKVVIGQRLHAYDVPGICEEEGDWEILKLPMEYVPTTRITAIGWRDPRTKPGELLHPARVSASSLESLKKELQSPFAIAAQLQQEPVPLEGGLIKKDWLKTYYQLPKLDAVVISADFRNDGKNLETDQSHSVALVIGKRDDFYFLIDEFRGLYNISEEIDMVNKAVKKYPKALKVLIEGKGTGNAIETLLKSSIKKLQLFNPQGLDKEGRLQACMPTIYKGNLFLPDEKLFGKDWVPAFRDELTTFPRARTDDRVDALTQAIIWLNSQGGLLKLLEEVIIEDKATQRATLRNTFYDNIGYSSADLSRNSLRNVFK